MHIIYSMHPKPFGTLCDLFTNSLGLKNSAVRTDRFVKEMHSFSSFLPPPCLFWCPAIEGKCLLHIKWALIKMSCLVQRLFSPSRYSNKSNLINRPSNKFHSSAKAALRQHGKSQTGQHWTKELHYVGVPRWSTMKQIVSLKYFWGVNTVCRDQLNY